MQNDRSGPIITFGPLNQYLRPGWRPPPSTFISLGNSSLCTQIKEYATQILDLIVKMETLLKEYDSVSGVESTVTRHLMGLYQQTKEACLEQIDGTAIK